MYRLSAFYFARLASDIPMIRLSSRHCLLCPTAPDSYLRGHCAVLLFFLACRVVCIAPAVSLVLKSGILTCLLFLQCTTWRFRKCPLPPLCTLRIAG